MCTTDQFHFVLLKESLDYVRTKKIACATRRHVETWGVFGVRPKEITHGSVMGYFLFSVDDSYVIDGVNRRGEATVNAEDAVVNNGGQSETVKDFGTTTPDSWRSVFAKALIVETIDLKVVRN